LILRPIERKRIKETKKRRGKKKRKRKRKRKRKMRKKNVESKEVKRGSWPQVRFQRRQNRERIPKCSTRRGKHLNSR